MSKSEKIIQLCANSRVNWRALLAQVAEREGVDAVVMVVRTNNQWTTCWGSGDAELNLGSLSMATLKLMSDVQLTLHEIDKP